ncbi:MAG: hypothetical protein BHV99_00430 [Clostridium sp. 26_21]|nr:MAG: hypothetical protein BHV99_00430 [Clostridium sp. 26_21]
MKKRNVIILAIAMIIIIAGVIVTFTIGFNKQLRYQESQKIDIYVASEVDVKKIKDIANEVLGRNNMVQTIEIYQDMVTIRAKSISDEQKDTIVNKVKENYEFEQTAENTEISNIPATRIRDILKKYILPMSLSFVIILVYMTVRYHEKGMLKVMLQTIVFPAICEIILCCLIAITRMPVGVYTPTLILIVYLASITYTVIRIENQPDVAKK